MKKYCEKKNTKCTDQKKIISKCAKKNNDDVQCKFQSMGEKMGTLVPTNKEANISEIINSLDMQICNNMDYMQEQINFLNISYSQLIDEVICENKKYQKLASEINKIPCKINEIINMDTCSHTCEHQCGKKMFTDTNKEHKFVIEHDIEFICLTMVAGGGAGGVGFVKDMFFYSGGGGGSGACLINCPIPVKKGTIIKIQVGKGGNLNTKRNGQNTIVEIINPDLKMQCIQTNGGENGCPSIECEKDVSGGIGGISGVSVLSGANGQNGMISMPSARTAIAGNGGNSVFFNGGNGGGNMFGIGGTGGTIDELIGQDGKFGSGGGGSCPRNIIDTTQKISGNGGDGLVIIEW